MLTTFGSIYICKEEFSFINFQESKFCSLLNAARRCYGTFSCFKFHNRHIQDNQGLHISAILLKIVIICKCIGTNIFTILVCLKWRSQWPWDLRRGSAAACLLGLWVRIPPRAWMFVCCWYCVVTYRSLRWADHSSGRILPSVACLSMIVNPR